MFDLIIDNVRFFSSNQQTYFNSDRFPFYQKHAVIEILDSSDEEDGGGEGDAPKIKTAARQQDVDKRGKAKWQIR